jgi:hypothetical protein
MLSREVRELRYENDKLDNAKSRADYLEKQNEDMLKEMGLLHK